MDSKEDSPDLEHNSAVSSWIKNYEEGMIEQFLPRLDKAFADARQELSKAQNEVDYFYKIGHAVRLAESFARYLAGQKPSKYFQPN